MLVVDNDRDVREAIETALELEGHRVSPAGDGAVPSKQLDRAEFDAVVLRLLMPNLDGFEVSRRSSSQFQRPRVLLS